MPVREECNRKNLQNNMQDWRENEMTGKNVTKQIGTALETVGQGVVTLVHNGPRQFKNLKRPLKQMYKSCEGVGKKAVSYAHKEPLTSVFLGVGTGVLVGWLMARER